MCLLCVSIRACAKSPNVTVCNPDKRAEKSEIFPGIPLPALFTSTPKEVGLGLSLPSAAAIEAMQMCYNFSFLLSLRVLFPGERSRAQGFLPVPPHLHSQRPPGCTSFPGSRRVALRTRGLGPGPGPRPRRWVVLSPPPPSPGDSESRALGVCARARADLVGKSPSVEAAECRWQSILEPGKSLQALELPERKTD